MYLVANEASFKAAAQQAFTNNGCINRLDEEDWQGIDGGAKRIYPAVVTFYGAIGTTHEPSSSWITLAQYVKELTAKVDAISNF